MNEHEYDDQLGVITTGRQDWSLRLAQYHPYEATPYHALNTLFQAYDGALDGKFIDYGCGKGRLLFYLHHYYARCGIGIEVDKRRWAEAEENLLQYQKKHEVELNCIQFECCPAEMFEVDSSFNRFYFFNPFAVHIFKKVVGQILQSIKQHPRQVDLILYYPDVDYLEFLHTHTPFYIAQDIPIAEWYEQDQHERFLIYKL